MTTKDIEGAVPHPRGARDPRHNPLNTNDIEGAQPRKIMGYTGKHPEVIRENIDKDLPQSLNGTMNPRQPVSEFHDKFRTGY